MSKQGVIAIKQYSVEMTERENVGRHLQFYVVGEDDMKTKIGPAEAIAGLLVINNNLTHVMLQLLGELVGRKVAQQSGGIILPGGKP